MVQSSEAGSPRATSTSGPEALERLKQMKAQGRLGGVHGR